MKTIKMKSSRVIGIIAMILLIGAQMMANVKIYQYSGYKGKAIECSQGEHSISKFSKHFYKTPYCSVKVPSGYLLDVDYYGRGWKKGTYKTYTNNVSRLSVKFKNIRIRKANNYPSEDGDEYNQPDCGNNWAVQFYERTNYKGKYDCYSAGKRKYVPSFGKYPQSVKVKKGYELIVVFNKRQVKKITGSKSYVRLPKFDYIELNKIGTKPPVDTKPGDKPACGNDWAVQFYQNSSYKGKYECFTAGEHKYTPSFGAYPKSVKVKKGYKLLVVFNKRPVKTITSSKGYVNLPKFDYIILQKMGSNPPLDNKPNTPAACGNDWAVQFYQGSSYKGKYNCYSAGKHKYASSYGSSPKSVKVKKGYKVLIMYRGRQVQEITSSKSYVKLPNFDYIIMDKLSNEKPSVPTACIDNWVVQFYASTNYKGNLECFTTGKHKYASTFVKNPKSIKVKKGYKVLIMYRGRQVQEITSSKSYVKLPNFDYIMMSKVSDEKPSVPTACIDNWVVQFYASSNYKGNLECFTAGKHKYASTFVRNPKSIKVKKGYKVLIMHRGRQVKEITSSSSYIKLPTFDYIMMSKVSSHSGGRGSSNRQNSNTGRVGTSNNRNSNWGVQFYEENSFSSKAQSFSQGDYTLDLPAGFVPKALKVKPGYEVTLFFGTSVVRFVTGMTYNINYKFYRF
ncbi:MAG: hypothetical protein AAFO07_12420 [Bacteroidota bacterium]